MKVLWICPWAPPAIRPQAILAGRLLPALRRAGATIGLVTNEPAPADMADQQWHTFDQPGAHNIRSRLVHLLSRDATKRFMWGHPAWRKAIRGAAKEFDPDIIVGFANPYMANVAAMDASNVAGVPFISHYSDPYVNNQFGASGSKSMRRTEQRILAASAGTVFIGEALRRHVVGSSRPHHALIPHTTAVLPPSEPVPVIRHLGAFYGPRSPTTFMQALSNVSDGFWEHCERVELIGANASYAGGSFEPHLKNYPKLRSHVRVLPQVPYRAGTRLVATARINVCIDPPMTPSIYLPTKFIEYLGASRPLLALTTPNSPVAQICDEVGAVWTDVRDAQAIAFALEEMIREPARGVPDRTAIRRFGPEQVADQWLSYLRRFA